MAKLRLLILLSLAYMLSITKPTLAEDEEIDTATVQRNGHSTGADVAIIVDTNDLNIADFSAMNTVVAFLQNVVRELPNDYRISILGIGNNGAVLIPMNTSETREEFIQHLELLSFNFADPNVTNALLNMMKEFSPHRPNIGMLFTDGLNEMDHNVISPVLSEMHSHNNLRMLVFTFNDLSTEPYYLTLIDIPSSPYDKNLYSLVEASMDFLMTEENYNFLADIVVNATENIEMNRRSNATMITTPEPLRCSERIVNGSFEHCNFTVYGSDNTSKYELPVMCNAMYNYSAMYNNHTSGSSNSSTGYYNSSATTTSNGGSMYGYMESGTNTTMYSMMAAGNNKIMVNCTGAVNNSVANAIATNGTVDMEGMMCNWTVYSNASAGIRNINASCCWKLEMEMDKCSSSPCLNGAVCRSIHDDFHCACQTGYSGDRCDKRESSSNKEDILMPPYPFRCDQRNSSDGYYGVYREESGEYDDDDDDDDEDDVETINCTLHLPARNNITAMVPLRVNCSVMPELNMMDMNDTMYWQITYMCHAALTASNVSSIMATSRFYLNGTDCRWSVNSTLMENTLYAVCMRNITVRQENETMFCTADVQRCADGSYVSRDPQNNCQFKACMGCSNTTMVDIYSCVLNFSYEFSEIAGTFNVSNIPETCQLLTRSIGKGLNCLGVIGSSQWNNMRCMDYVDKQITSIMDNTQLLESVCSTDQACSNTTMSGIVSCEASFDSSYNGLFNQLLEFNSDNTCSQITLVESAYWSCIMRTTDVETTNSTACAVYVYNRANVVTSQIETLKTLCDNAGSTCAPSVTYNIDACTYQFNNTFTQATSVLASSNLNSTDVCRLVNDTVQTVIRCLASIDAGTEYCASYIGMNMAAVQRLLYSDEIKSICRNGSGGEDSGKSNEWECDFDPPHKPSCQMIRQEQHVRVDDLDWEIHSNGTMTAGTGPSRDYNHMYYILFEASSNSTVNKTSGDLAVLYLPQVNYSGRYCLEFKYHMYGAHMGMLELLTIAPDTNEWISEWSREGNQGDQWNSGEKTLYLTPASFVSFAVTRGASDLSDVGLDELEMSCCSDECQVSRNGTASTPRPTPSGSTASNYTMFTSRPTNATSVATSSSSTTPTSRPTPSSSPSTTPTSRPTQSSSQSTTPTSSSTTRPTDAVTGTTAKASTGGPIIRNCTFDDSNDGLCGMINNGWTLHTGATRSGGTGPDATKTDYYLYLEASDVKNGESVSLNLNVAAQAPGNYCLSFDYHMASTQTDHMGDLTVQTVKSVLNQEQRTNIFVMSGKQGNQWRSASVNISMDAAMQIEILASRRNGHEGDIAIDNIMLKDCSARTTIISSTPTTTITTTSTSTARPPTTITSTSRPSTTTTTSTARPPTTVTSTSRPSTTTSTARPPTTRPTTTTATQPTTGTVLVDCSFEDSNDRFCGMVNTGLYDWDVGTGRTPSDGTGPDSAFSGSWYMFFEASKNRQTGDTAKLKVNAAPQSAGNYCMSFQYHMYTAFGDHMGDLSVIARSGMQGQEITYFNVAGNQGNQWLKADIIIPMNSSTQIEIVYRRGRFFQSDASIDDIYIQDCSGGATVPTSSTTTTTTPTTQRPTSTTTTSQPSTTTTASTARPTTTRTSAVTTPVEGVSLINCTFEDINNPFCGMNSSKGQYPWINWSGRTNSSGTGPEQAHSQQRYIHMEASGRIKNAISKLDLNIMAPVAGSYSLSFYYHMYTSHADHQGALVVSYGPENGPRTNISIANGNMGQQWNYAQVTVPMVSSTVVEIWAIRGTGFQSDIAIDDLIFSAPQGTTVSSTARPTTTTSRPTTARPTSTTTSPRPTSTTTTVRSTTATSVEGVSLINCTFEDINNPFCGMNSSKGQYPWINWSGRTNSSGTGPEQAHSQHRYIHMEASGRIKNAISKLDLNIMAPVAGSYSLSFYYHMYTSHGDHQGALVVSYGPENGPRTNISIANGNMGQQWNYAQVTVLMVSSTVVEIWAIRGTGFQSDIAIDDLIFSAPQGTTVSTSSSTARPTTTTSRPTTDRPTSTTTSPRPTSTTTTVRSTTATSAQPTAVVFGCSFENAADQFCGMDNAESLKWTRHTGETRSGGTGPLSAKDQSYYAYIEASGVRENTAALLTKSVAELSGTYQLSFYYSMYGENREHMGTLNIKTRDNQENLVTVWTRSKDDVRDTVQSIWLSATKDLDLNNIKEIQFEAVKGNAYQSDIAIDDIKLVGFGVATTSTTTTTTTTTPPHTMCVILFPCLNGGTCIDVDGGSDYFCNCHATGFRGRNCEIIDITTIPVTTPRTTPPYDTACFLLLPCQNGATCIDIDDGSDYFCNCLGTGYEGRICSVEITTIPPTTTTTTTRPITHDPACFLTSPCRNGGTCVDTNDGYRCECTGTGFTGTDCDQVITTIPPQTCTDNTCLNGGLCLDINGQAFCSCTNTGFDGDRCQNSLAGDCSSTNCLNNGICFEVNGVGNCNCSGTNFEGTQCQTASYLFTCGFETNERGGEWCGITQADSTYDTMDWIRQTGRTPSGQTGPDAAIKGSYYAYIEASGKSPNDNAVLLLPVVDRAGTFCLSFSYHMYGNHIKDLIVSTVFADDTSTLVGIWQLTGEVDQQWHEAKISTLMTSGARFAITGTVDGEYSGDIAIDEILLESGISASSCSSKPPTAAVITP